MIRVTQGMIDKGARGSARCCPVALALKELPNIHSVFVTRERIAVYFANDEGKPGSAARFATPPDMHAFIYAFDLGRPVGPTEFPVPDALISCLQAAGKRP
jgi:hypothetical protein